MNAVIDNTVYSLIWAVISNILSKT